MPSEKIKYFLRCLLWHWLLASSLSYPIHHFIIHETRSGTLLEFSRINDASIYDGLLNTTKSTVILLTNNPKQKFADLETLVSDEVNFIYDRRDTFGLKTPQVHVLIRSSHSTVLPGTVKFMVPLKRMNSTDIAKFINASIIIERDIISPNIEKALCFPDQQVVLMNTVLGNYRSFTMYVVNWSKAANFTNSTIEEGIKLRNNETQGSGLQLPATVAREVLNPIRCDLIFGNDMINVDF